NVATTILTRCQAYSIDDDVAVGVVCGSQGFWMNEQSPRNSSLNISKVPLARINVKLKFQAVNYAKIGIIKYGTNWTKPSYQ
ncbi:hypothetical protein X798_04383, partial [Onchocerca flexuosa]